MTPQIRLIASDLDGTLLNEHSEISAFNLQAIQRARAAGIIFALSTGRFAENAAQIAQDAGLDCPVISLNGAVVELQPYAQRIHEEYLSPEASQAIYEALEEMGEGYYMFGKAAVISRRDWPRHISERDEQQLAKLQQHVRYSYGEQACREAVSQPQHKYFIYHSNGGRDLAEIANVLSQIPGVELTQSGERNLEIMPQTASKGRGLRLLTQTLGIPQENVMALGDQLNDLSMITWAGLGIAMGNATARVQQAADAVTDSNIEDGVGKAIFKHCFGED